GFGRRQVFAGYLGDHRDDDRARAADADKATDGGADLGNAHVRGREKSHPGERTGHRNHTSEIILWHRIIVFPGTTLFRTMPVRAGETVKPTVFRLAKICVNSAAMFPE